MAKKTSTEAYVEMRNTLIKTIVNAARDERLETGLRIDIISQAFEFLEKNARTITLVGIAEAISDSKGDRDEILASLITMGLEASVEMAGEKEKIINLLELANEQCKVNRAHDAERTQV
jgi:hypothetical protein